MPRMRTLLAGACCFTIAASGLARHHGPGAASPRLPDAGRPCRALRSAKPSDDWLYLGQLSGLGARVVLTAGATGIVAAGGRAIAVNLTRPHFEGYAVMIGAALILQGLLTLWSLYVRRPRALGRTAPIW